jgi:hypothetical protein
LSIHSITEARETNSILLAGAAALARPMGMSRAANIANPDATDA